MMKKEDALLLLLSTGKKEMSIRDAVSIIEMVTKDPLVIREVLESAEEEGLIKRHEKTVYISSSAPQKKLSIRRVDCDSACKRCGVKIKNCYYIDAGSRELGPYGSECVNRIL